MILWSPLGVFLVHSFLSLFSFHLQSLLVAAKVHTLDDLDPSVQYVWPGCLENSPRQPCNGCGDQPDRQQLLQGGWQDCVKNSKFSITFTGTAITLVGASPITSWCTTGIIVTIDGGSAQRFPIQRTSTRQYHYPLASISGLSKGQHTAKVVVFEDNCPIFFDYYTYDDGADVQPPTPPKPTTKPTPTPTPTPTPVPGPGPGPTTTETPPNPTISTTSALDLNPTTEGETGTVSDGVSAPLGTQTVSGSSSTGTGTSIGASRAKERDTGRTTELQTITVTDAAGNLVPVETQIVRDSAGNQINSSSKGPNVAAIAGGAVGGVVLIALLGIFCWRRRRRQRKLAFRNRFQSYRSDGMAFGNNANHISLQTQPPAYDPTTPTALGSAVPLSDRLFLAHSANAAGAGDIPTYSRDDANAESAQLATFVSDNSDVITPDLAERLQVARYRPLYDPDMISVANWWEWFKVTPFEVGLLRDLYTGGLDGSSQPSPTIGGSLTASSEAMGRYDKSIDGMIYSP